jgi:hypothetical protein
VRVWGPKSGQCKHVFQGHGFHQGPVTTLASHHEGALMLTGTWVLVQTGCVSACQAGIIVVLQAAWMALPGCCTW